MFLRLLRRHAHRRRVRDDGDLALEVDVVLLARQRVFPLRRIEIVAHALIHQRMHGILRRLHRPPGRQIHQPQMVLETGAVQPLKAARQRRQRPRGVERERVRRAPRLQLFRQVPQRRLGLAPAFQSAEQVGRDRARGGGAREIARDDDEFAVARVVAERCEFHGGPLQAGRNATARM